MMNNKEFFVLPVILLLLALAILAAGCTTPVETSANPGNTASLEKVEVYHFHATRQCYSCITIGA
jgi:hypothetical protein